MTETKEKRYGSTTAAIYFSYFIMGLGMSLLAQFKPEFAKLWHTNIAGVLAVGGAVGIGGIISILVTGPVSDKFGRRISAVIDHLGWAIYYIGLLYAPNQTVAYIIAIIGGISNSFLNSSNFPTLMEIFPKAASAAGLMSKFAINLGQFFLPIAIMLGGFIGLPYRVVFMATGIFYLALAIILIFAPYPSQVAKAKTETQAEVPAQKHRFNVGTVCLILMGFTTTAAFLLWINTYQELARSYGISQPSTLQSVYAIGASVAVLFNSLIVKKGVKEIDILIYYPLITAVGLALAYFIQKPWILYVTSLVVGFFAASGLYQLTLAVLGKLYADMKATAQSWAGFFSAFANFAIISLAAWITSISGSSAPRNIVILNVINMLVSTILAIMVKGSSRKEKSK